MSRCVCFVTFFVFLLNCRLTVLILKNILFIYFPPKGDTTKVLVFLPLPLPLPPFKEQDTPHQLDDDGVDISPTEMRGPPRSTSRIVGVQLFPANGGRLDDDDDEDDELVLVDKRRTRKGRKRWTNNNIVQESLFQYVLFPFHSCLLLVLCWYFVGTLLLLLLYVIEEINHLSFSFL